MKKCRQNDKTPAKSLAQVIMLLIISAALFAGCKNTARNNDMPETDETNPVQTDEPLEFTESKVTAADHFTEDKNISLQSDQTALPCSAPILSVKTTVREHYCGTETLSIRYDEISLSGDGFESAAQAVSEWNKQDIAQIERLSDYAGYTNKLSSDIDCYRIDSSVISFNQRWCDQDGFTYYRGINFDVTSGRKLALADILIDKEGFDKKAAEIAAAKLLEIPEADKLPSGYEKDVAYEFSNGILDSENQWYLDAYGIVYIYTNFEDTIRHGYLPNHHEDFPETYEEQARIDSSLPGNITVTIPYEDVAEYMNPAYCGIQNIGAAKFSVNETVHVNLSDGKVLEQASYERSSGSDFSELDTVLITLDETGPDENMINRISIAVNNRKETFETEARMQDAYLLCLENGSTYLLFDTTLADHDDTTYLYDITDGGIAKREELEFARIIKPVNSNSFILQEYMTVFGAHFCHATYMIDESTGKVVYPEMFYTDARNNNITITLTRELPVVIYDEETTLPPGTPIQVTAFDNGSKTAYFYELNYGLEGEFYYTMDNWTMRINGLEESSYFDLDYGG